MSRAGALVLALAFAAGCAPAGGSAPPRLEAGVLDLGGWDCSRDGPVALNGQWAFRWRALEGESPPPAIQREPAPPYIVLPVFWNGHREGGAELGAEGWASFRARLLPGTCDAVQALRVRSVYSAYRLWVDGRLVASAGRVARGPADEVPRLSDDLVHLPPGDPGEPREIVLEVSNHHYHRGGLYRSVDYGSAEQLVRSKQAARSVDLFLLGVIAIMAVYHAALYLLRRQERSTLFFSIFCALIGVRLATSGHMAILDLAPRLDFELLVKLQFLSYYLGAPVFLSFARTLFPDEVSRRFTVAWWAGSGALAALVVATPAAFYGRYTAQAFEYVVVASSIYLAAVLVVAARNGREGAGTILLGLSLFVAAQFHDLLTVRQRIESLPLFPLAVAIFVFLQSLILSRRFTRAFFSVEELSEEIQEKNRSLVRLDRLKDEFLANTSHELRTPLHGIIGLADSMRSDQSVGVRNRRNVDMIALSARRLANLVNDILDFSKLRESSMELSLRPVDVGQVAEMVVLLSEPLAKSRGISLALDVPDDLPLAMADEDRLQQILLNLVGNGVKFTHQGGVTVACREADGRLRVSVRDTGIGIPEDKHERIFESFEQADGSTAREYGGTGLGLTVARQLVELHGSRIELESAPGRGSLFQFDLALADADAPRPESAARPEAEARVAGIEPPSPEAGAAEADEVVSPPAVTGERPLRVLVADDEPVNLLVVENHLRARGFQVEAAGDGPAALRRIEASPPDLVLLDVMMPRMNGYEVAARIREKHDRLELPIIMLTAKNQLEDLRHGFASGANDYLTKPFHESELISRIEAHLDLSVINRATRHFVPEPFLDILQKESIVSVRAGDHMQGDMTVMFSDIRSYSTLSESMSPGDVFRFLNGYLGRIGPRIRAEGGFVNQYFGDGIMAVFPRSPDDAVRAAISMQMGVSDYNRARQEKGRAPLRVGVGLHHGPLMLGILGDDERLDGSVVADAVNLASRIEGLTKFYGAGILMSDDLRDRLEDPGRYALRRLDRVRVQGRQGAVSVIEILDAEPEALRKAKLETRADFEEAGRLYREGEFAAAAVFFRRCRERAEDDAAARVYLERALHYAEHGAPPDWEGVSEMLRK